MVICSPIDRVDAPKLCAQLRSLVSARGAARIVCDVGALVAPDAVTVDALAALAAHRAPARLPAALAPRVLRAPGAARVRRTRGRGAAPASGRLRTYEVGASRSSP